MNKDLIQKITRKITEFFFNKFSLVFFFVITNKKY